MKNILLGLTLMIILLPQVSFGANPAPVVVKPPIIVSPQEIACDQQLAVESKAFWGQQAVDRGNFGKNNPTAMATHDRRFHEGLAISMRQRVGKPYSDLPAQEAEDPTFSAFEAKQQSDKLAFLAKLAQDKQNCLNPTVTTTTPGT